MAEHTLTTADGIPVADNQNSLMAGDRSPVLIHLSGQSISVIDTR
ncbi:MAG: catalase [Myxacorys chilensis ATA2-1-KO14]|jgi:catalase|nr:catalase [Myxacorys chilensis ATA2-1-KO14]